MSSVPLVGQFGVSYNLLYTKQTCQRETRTSISRYRDSKAEQAGLALGKLSLGNEKVMFETPSVKKLLGSQHHTEALNMRLAD